MKISTLKDYLFFTWISLPAIFYVINPEIRSYGNVMLITYVINILICFKKPRYILPSYLMYLLISPLWFNWFGLGFILLNFFPLFFIILYIVSRNQISISKNLALILGILFIICFFSLLISPHIEFLFFGIINFINVMIVIVIAYDYIKKEPNFELLEQFIILAGVVITSIMIASYMQINLSDFLMLSSGVIEEVDNWLIFMFPKATYFYNNVFIPLEIDIYDNSKIKISNKKSIVPLNNKMNKKNYDMRNILISKKIKSIKCVEMFKKKKSFMEKIQGARLYIPLRNKKQNLCIDGYFIEDPLNISRVGGLFEKKEEDLKKKIDFLNINNHFKYAFITQISIRDFIIYENEIILLI